MTSRTECLTRRIEVPAGFLKTCGEPLCRVIARFAQTSLGAEYFPCRFRDARVVVLRELRKTATQLQGWLPIALLNIGKIIEVIVAERIADAAEKNGLLPTSQIGNRRNRSTELAVRLLTGQVRMAWAVATLLQLDILHTPYGWFDGCDAT